MNAAFIDQLAARLRDAFATSPAHDLQRNVRELVASALGQLDLVTRSEYDIQLELLARAREKLEALEARVAELEARAPAGPRPDAVVDGS